jgi:hypothetical protein
MGKSLSGVLVGTNVDWDSLVHFIENYTLLKSTAILKHPVYT